MNVVNCRSCGRLFNVIANERMCPACRQALEDKFQQVKEYLGENKNASVEQVSRDNDVSVKQIRQWIREERLTFAEGSVDGIECEKCGKMIRTGRFCESCKLNMATEFMGAMDRPKKPVEAPVKKSGHEKDRMRYLN